MSESVSSAGKTILFLCKCSSNISKTVDFESVTEWARNRGDVNIVAVSNLLCSPAGKDFYTDVLKGKNVRSVVVAACSPKQHEKTFQELAEDNGLNMSTVHMANIREQCAWVTTDRGEATEKAKNLINAAVKRSFHAEDLHRQTMIANPDVLIIGGGVAGIENALTLSKAGRKVYLVEKEISLGGSVIKIEDVAPNMECSPCMLSPILADVRDDSNIQVISNAVINDVLGFFGNFTVKLRQKARYVEESCIGCEECFAVCPVSIKSSFHNGLGERKAIYTLFPGSVPAAAAIDRDFCKHFVDGSCDACVAACPFGSINFDQEDLEMELQVGSIVVATGFESGDPSPISELGYGRIAGVYTTPEFERLASSNGPTGGEIQLKDGRVPSSVAVIHCAGSLRDDGIPYCSSVCCTGALKVGEFLRKINPDATVYNIHNDLVFSNPKEFKFYKKQVDDGTGFIRCINLSTINVTETGSDGMLSVTGEGFDALKVEMVVLATGLAPAAGTRDLSQMMNVDLDENGYFMPDHEILHATGSALDGIYIAGCAAMPGSISTSITQAQAVAGDLLSKLVPGRELELEVMTSCIDEESCAGCKLCISVCPYKAISFDTEKSVSIVTEALCRGCGTCAATCPSGACTARHFSDDQIYAEIGGILDD